MTRISEIALQQILLGGFQRAQATAENTQIQLASGDKFQTYGGYGADALRLVSAEGIVERAGAYNTASNVAQSRLQTQEQGLTTIANSVAGIQADFVEVLATGTPELLVPQLEVAAQQILTALNTQLGGVYLFGGTDGTQPAVAASSLADLGAATSIDTLFQEGARTTIAVEEGVSISGGPVASEIATELLTELRDLANAEATLGSFSGNLTDAQRDFLIEKNARLTEINASLNEALGLNGVAQAQANDAVERNTAQRDFAEIVAADIENVDIAEALTRLNQDQLAIQASAQALAQASQLSLLDFL